MHFSVGEQLYFRTCWQKLGDQRPLIPYNFDPNGAILKSKIKILSNFPELLRYIHVWWYRVLTQLECLEAFLRVLGTF
jgi:hypothetical protein